MSIDYRCVVGWVWLYCGA